MADNFELRVLGREHVGAIGMTQSGKTFVLLRFLNQLKERNVLVLDTKHNVKIPGFKMVREEREITKMLKRHQRIIYRPRGTKPTPNLYQQIWDGFGSPRKPNLTLLIDEAGHVTGPNKIDEGLELLVQAGKQNGIGVWWAAQQSTQVSNTLLSQSEKLLVFRVLVETDRKKIANVWGKSVMGANQLRPREFMAFGFPQVEPLEADGKVDAIYLEAV